MESGSILSEKEDLPSGAMRTWSYHSALEDKDTIEYAQIYCRGASLTEECPPALEERWAVAEASLTAHLNAVRIAHIPLNEICIYDVVPERVSVEYNACKIEIEKAIFRKYAKPANHDFLVDVWKALKKLEGAKLSIDSKSLLRHASNPRAIKLFQKIRKGQIAPYIWYNLFGTKTGRLTTMPDGFPILTLDKPFREIIKPSNDWFVEFDYNAADLRVLLGLAGQEQPDGDLHEWNANWIFDGLERSEAKKQIFAWLYNPEYSHTAAEAYYKPLSVLSDCYADGLVTNPYGREIKSDDAHALNHLIQSTTNDLMFQKLIEIDKLLQGKKSRVAFTLHDSIVLDFSESDKNILELFNTFKETPYGAFKASVQVGKDFGHMKAVE